jgi:hypothetical protein
VRAWVAVCVLLLPAAFARGAVQVDAPSITRFGNWEIEVSIDPDTCEVSCDYRLRRDRFGRAPVTDFLLPPAVDVRVYTDGASKPITVTFDPAHTREPSLSAGDQMTGDDAMLPGARVNWKPPDAVSPAPPSAARCPVIPDAPSLARAASAPLRI